MKSIIYCILLLACLASCSRTPLKKVGLNTEFAEIDSTSQIKISKTEVTNKEYRIFLEGEGNGRHIYDSSRWSVMITEGDGDPMTRNYHWHPAFNDFPAVNITYESAVAYCNWLTRLFNQKDASTKVIVRLPTAEEFNKLIDDRKELIQGNYFDEYNYEIFINAKYLNLVDDSINRSHDGALYSMDTQRHQQSNLNSILGNVSEICEDGSALGGNWDTLPEDIMKPIDYTYPDPRIGFRIVIETLNK